MSSKASDFKYVVLTTIATLTAIVLYLMPFHAFLTIWLAAIFGHYTMWRLWKEVLLAVILVGAAYLLATDVHVRTHTVYRRLVWLIIAYGILQLIWGIVAYHTHSVNRKALAYGWLIDLRFLVFFLAAWTIALRTDRLRAQWERFIIWPALVVVVFGLLQAFILPHNFLQHFGYGPATIAPFETINHNNAYIRIMSTLRGANPLGTYLLIPLSYVLLKIAKGKRTWQWWLFLTAIAVTLFMTFSRSAWIGAVVSAATMVVLTVPKRRLLTRKMGVAAAVLLIGMVIAGLGLRNTTRFQNVFLHTQNHSLVKSTSDAGHASALKQGLHDIVHQPLGEGPGSAGPASVYNLHPARIAENYFIQVGQEVGWLGLAILLLIMVGVGYLLWLRRSDPLATILLASFLGITVINLLSHAWADDTLAYVWWGLAGIAMAPIKNRQQDA